MRWTHILATVPDVTQAHSHSHGSGPDHLTADLADLLDLDAAVLGGYLDDLVGWASSLAPDGVRRVVDLGAGTGVGTVALARRFGSAEVVAVDRSAEMLHRTLAAAEVAGVAGRVRAVPADLDDAWPPVGTPDVVWASSSLHEVAEPDRLLRGILAGLRPGGLLVVVEMDALPQVLPAAVGAGLGERCGAALAEAGWNAHPDWEPHLQRAGFEVVEQRTVALGSSADPSTTAAYARAWLRHVRRGLDGRLAAGDLAALDVLLADTGPDAVLAPSRVAVRGSRTAWAARRPAPDPDPSRSGGTR
jgi:ubiquinone/menaquinone biosynthesis C-methylase UbiE